MKNMLLILFCLYLINTASGEVRNGYNPEFVTSRYALDFLNRELMKPDISAAERRRIHAAMKQHTSVIAGYQLTETLLRQMSEVSSEMYREMSELRDKRGRITDIYVRFIPQERAEVALSGASFFQPSELDEDASHSRFGELTVSIDVWICDAALNLLAHEFGHTRYIVPNLAAYRKFYAATYSSFVSSSRFGHSAADESGKLAYQYGQRYLRDRRDYRMNSGKDSQRVANLVKQVRRRIKDEFEEGFNSTVASRAPF